MITKPTQFEIILTNESSEQMAIQYQLLDTPSAKIWLESIKNALLSGEVSETRLYNFPSKKNESLPNLIRQFYKTIEKLSGEFPELIEKKLDESSLQNLQSSLNDLHRNFAHNHLVERRLTKANFAVWHEFNALIHSIESELINLRYPIGPDQVRRMRIEFEWTVPFEQPIPEECFREFTLEQNFGDVNLIYCNVGRHLYELYHASDIESIPIEHIKTHSHFSANTGLNFGNNIGANWAAHETKKIHNWFLKHQEKFHLAGVYWENPNKALGFVTIARMLNPPSNIEARRSYQDILANFNKVKEVRFLTS